MNTSIQNVKLNTTGYNVEEACEKLQGKHPLQIVTAALSEFGKDLTISFSGAEDVILIDLAAKTNLPFSVFCLDTGRLHNETYVFLETVRKHYNINIEVFTPSFELLQPFVKEKGLMSFLTDGHSECCGIRKVEPLGRALAGRKAWATGQRKDQNPATRNQLQVVEADENHQSPEKNPLIKFNPLSKWSSNQVWDYIRANNIPYNPLHDLGYKSIGCAPCTRPSRPGEHERQSRWWWESDIKKECGLHLKH